MKTCPYCGRENEDSRVACHECGTTIHLIEPPPALPVATTTEETSAARLPANYSANPSSTTTLRRALFTCAGIIFVSTAVLIAGQRLFFDLQESANGGPIGKPGIYAVGMLFIPFLGLWVLVNLVFSMQVCTARFPSWKLAAIISLLAFTLSFLLIWVRDLRPFLPAVFLRRSLGLAPGYPGALLQFLLGAYLLGWLHIWLRKLRKTPPPSQLSNNLT